MTIRSLPAHQSVCSSGSSSRFETLSQILVLLMIAATTWFGFLLLPDAWGVMTEELLGGCVIGFAALLVVAVIRGEVRRLSP